jgi:hypothetical protein
MAPQAQQFLAGLELMLSGTYDIAAEALAITVLSPSWTPPNVNTTPLIFDAGAEVEALHTMNIGSQAWSWDATTRTRVLVPSVSPSFDVGTGTEGFRYAVLHDQDNAHPPFVLYTWPATITADSAADPQVFPVPSLLSVRLFSDSQPAPQGNVYTPTILQDSAGKFWRITALAGSLGAVATTEADERDVYLTAPDTTTRLLSVSTAGVVTAAATGTTPAAEDRVFSTARPCLLPSEDAAIQRVLTVSNTGALTVV